MSARVKNRGNRVTSCKVSTNKETIASLAALGVRAGCSICPRVDVLVGDVNRKALVDSGSARSLISLRFSQELSASGLIRQVWRFLVAGELCFPFILGADFIRRTGMILDLGNGRCFFRFSRRVSIPFSDEYSHGAAAVEAEGDRVSIPDPLGHLTVEQAEAIRGICCRFPEVLTPKLGVTKLLEYEIRLTDTRPDKWKR
ncbi:hypothetical protein J6590_075052 [Homalodisca vitripennis]|nr:hypothetical protein J6590_075052 [Homalodisca vitripennis]